ncbi:MAG: sulfite exporter TauE/SafE family protein [Gammaproteobacteria bacterium]
MHFEIADITVSVWMLLAWGGLVGFVFSTVGAAGGILASVGLISVFGLQDPNLVKPMAQALTLVTPLIAVPLYMRQCRVVYRLAFLLGAGGVLGALLGSSISVNLLSDMSVFKPVFAVLVFFIAAQLAWQIVRTNAATAVLTRTMQAAENFERHVKSGGDLCDMGVECMQASLRRFAFRFGAEEFGFNPWLPFFTGMGIAVLSSALGVGGGFLLVPFMSIVMRLPMYVIAGTSALAIAIHSITSISNYVRLGIELDYPLLGILMTGVVAGSVIGPAVSKYVPENGLRAFLCIVLVLIGLRYAGVY